MMTTAPGKLGVSLIQRRIRDRFQTEAPSNLIQFKFPSRHQSYGLALLVWLSFVAADNGSRQNRFTSSARWGNRTRFSFDGMKVPGALRRLPDHLGIGMA